VGGRRKGGGDPKVTVKGGRGPKWLGEAKKKDQKSQYEATDTKRRALGNGKEKRKGSSRESYPQLCAKKRKSKTFHHNGGGNITAGGEEGGGGGLCERRRPPKGGSGL